MLQPGHRETRRVWQQGKVPGWEEGCRSAQGTGSWSQPCLVSDIKTGDQCSSSMAFMNLSISTG